MGSIRPTSNSILIGKNLRRLREDHGMSHEVAAKRIGVSTRQVRRWEYGEQNIRSKWIPPICSVYHCDPNAVFMWTYK